MFAHTESGTLSGSGQKQCTTHGFTEIKDTRGFGCFISQGSTWRIKRRIIFLHLFDIMIIKRIIVGCCQRYK